MHNKDSDSPVARVPLPAAPFELEDVAPEVFGETLNPLAPIALPPAPLPQNDIEHPANVEPQTPPILQPLPNAEVQVVPALLPELESAPRPRIIELIEQPNNMDEVIAYIATASSEELMQLMDFVVPNLEHIRFSPYTYVLYKERFDILRVMIEAISREQVIFPVNQLRVALSMGHHFSEIELLIECGANIFSPMKEGSSIEILDFVYTFNRLDVLDYLVKSKRLNLAADIKRRPFRLHQTVASGADLMVEMLLLSGADPHARIDCKILLPNQADENPREITPMETLVETDVNSRVSLLEFFEQNPTPLSVSGLKSNFSRTVQLMLETGADCTIANQFGENVFHILALYGIENALGDSLVKAGLDINQQTKYAHTPLHIAAKMGQDESLRCLLALGANPKIQDDLGRYPVYYSRRTETFKILYSYYERYELETEYYSIQGEMRQGRDKSKFLKFQQHFIGYEGEESASKIDEDYVENLMERLMTAIIAKDIIMIQKILEEKPLIKNIIDKLRNNILLGLITEKIDDPAIFRLFFSIVTEENLSNDSSIHMILDKAMRSSNNEVCEILLAVTPSEVLFSKERLNPVFKCCKHNRLDLLQILEEKGVDIHQTLVSGLSTLHVACEYRSADVAVYLIEKGADLHAKFLDRRDLVSRAPIDIVQPILDYDQYEHILKPMECVPMAEHIKILRALNFNFFNDVAFLAKYYNYSHVILSTDDDLNDLLLEYIAKWDVVANNIDTPQKSVLSRALLYAARYGALKNAHTLLRFGALINYTDKLGLSALHWSVLFKQKSLTQYLIESGADTTLQSRAGFTPLQLAYNASAKKNLRSYLISMCTPIVPKENPPTSLELSSVGVVPLLEKVSYTKNTWKLSLSDLDFPQTAKLKAMKYQMSFSDWPNVVPNLTGIMEHLTSSTLVINQTLSQGYHWPGKRQYYSLLPFETASDGYTVESLVCLEARNIAMILENTNPCRSALLDLSSKGFRGMKTLELNQHFATPGLKLLYDHRDQNTPVGVFVRCNLLTIQRARKEILYKALIANSLFSVCPSADIVNGLCGTITHDDIPQSDAQSSALMKMLPGTSGVKKQSGPQS